MKARLVYSREYDIHFPGLSLLHPFDGRKYGRAWEKLERRFGTQLDSALIVPDREVTREELLLVHTPAYLESLQSPQVVARAIEVGAAGWLPASVLDSRLLRPMRYATYGTMLAAEAARGGAAAFNLGGGYHHAFADRGEGFCLYADVAVAIRWLRQRGVCSPQDEILVIDLDAHRGNGIEHILQADARVHFLDLYNFQIYPGPAEDPGEDSFLIPLRAGWGDEQYLEVLQTELDRFLKSAPLPALAFYNAGTDVIGGDPLGQMNLTDDGVFERDRQVIDALVARNIPFVALTSGGYTERSASLISRTATHILERCG